MKIISCMFSKRTNQYILKYYDKNHKVRYLPVDQYIYTNDYYITNNYYRIIAV